MFQDFYEANFDEEHDVLVEEHAHFNYTDVVCEVQVIRVVPKVIHETDAKYLQDSKYMQGAFVQRSRVAKLVLVRQELVTLTKSGQEHQN